MSNAIKTTDTQTRAELISVLENSLYPGAKKESIEMVLGYCQAAGLDPMQKPVHIVPIWDGKAGVMRDVVMPGINLYRIQASRSGECAGVSEPEFGEDVDGIVGGAKIVYPKWCKVTVKRMMPNGIVVDFTAKELWVENYAQKGGKDKSVAPNAMWTKRPYAQLAKCAEAQAFRKAFPELAAAYTAEEMEGKQINEQDFSGQSNRNPSYVSFENEHLQNMRDAAMDGMDALSSAFNALPKSELKTQFWAEHGTALKKCAEDAVVIAGEAQNG